MADVLDLHEAGGEDFPMDEDGDGNFKFIYTQCSMLCVRLFHTQGGGAGLWRVVLCVEISGRSAGPRGVGPRRARWR